MLVVIVCFRDEAWCLPEFLASMTAQTRAADHLVLVDDGSSDASGSIADEYASGRDAVVVHHRPNTPRPADRLAEANELKAFQWAVSQLDTAWDFVGKMDGDLRLSPMTLETIDHAFRANPRLGMAGAQLSEVRPDDRIVKMVSPRDHVEGATKFYRRACWEQIAPLPPILGWDTLDEFRARMRGWETESFAVSSGDPIHLRRMGTHGPILRSFRRWGACSYGYGSHPLHVLLYGAQLGIRRKPRVIGGLNYLAGWGTSVIRRAPRAEPELRDAVRREQLRRIRLRARRPLGHRSA